MTGEIYSSSNKNSPILTATQHWLEWAMPSTRTHCKLNQIEQNYLGNQMKRNENERINNCLLSGLLWCGRGRWRVQCFANRTNPWMLHTRLLSSFQTIVVEKTMATWTLVRTIGFATMPTDLLALALSNGKKENKNWSASCDWQMRNAHNTSIKLKEKVQKV